MLSALFESLKRSFLPFSFCESRDFGFFVSHTEKLVNLFQGAKASLKKRAFFKEPVEPVNLLANLFAAAMCCQWAAVGREV